MPRHRILCSTGALLGMANHRDWRLLADCRERLQCDGYELMFYDNWYPQIPALTRFLKEIRLPIRSWHCEKQVGELLSQEKRAEAFSQFEKNLEMAAGLGAEIMVLHLWNGPLSDRYIEKNLAAYPALASMAQSYSIDLTVENVVCAHGDPLTHWKTLIARYPAAGLTLDTKMAAFHRQLNQICLPENGGLWRSNIRHIHLNDYGGGYLDWQNLRTLHPGQGHIDFDAFFSFLKTADYPGDFTVEATSFLPDGVIRWEDLNRTFAWLRTRLAGLGHDSAENHSQ